MSTIFGVLKPGNIRSSDEQFDKEDYIEVAYRTNRGNMIWTNELAPLLPDELLVYPLDNTHQGIFTIGDIKSKIT